MEAGNLKLNWGLDDESLQNLAFHDHPPRNMDQPETSLWSTIQIHIFFILVGLGLNAFMKFRSRQGFAPAKSAHILNNNIYAIFSALLCLALLFDPDSQLKLGYIYHFSKFYESLDIYFFLLSGSIPNAHFAVHHATTPFITADSVIGHSSAEWRWPAITNTLHHFFMYSFFGGRSEFRIVLPITGTAQLLVGVWKAGTMAVETSGEKGSIALVLYVVYAMLYVKELRDTRGGKE
jgi:GNS1/SUR4 family